MLFSYSIKDVKSLEIPEMKDCCMTLGDVVLLGLIAVSRTRRSRITASEIEDHYTSIGDVKSL